MRALLFLVLSAFPALAHDGGHLHPHDSGTWIIAVLALALIAAVLVSGRAVFRRKPRE